MFNAGVSLAGMSSNLGENKTTVFQQTAKRSIILYLCAVPRHTELGTCGSVMTAVG
jgi:hypothetical protein